MAKKGRVILGARPTGRQHLGNYLGAIKNYVALHDEYDCVYCIVDLHALTTVEDTENLRQNTYEMALDWLGGGGRPPGTTTFYQTRRYPLVQEQRRSGRDRPGASPRVRPRDREVVQPSLQDAGPDRAADQD